MNIFIDFTGHPALDYSMHLLFEKRLGWKLYRPINADNKWEEIGIRVQGHFCSGVPKIIDNIQHIPIEIENVCKYIHRNISFEQFLKLDFKFMVITSSENVTLFHNILKQYKPESIIIRHLANIGAFGGKEPVGDNFLLSLSDPMPSNINWIKYYPEHSEAFFYSPDVKYKKTIKSFFNCLDSYPIDRQLWGQLETILKEFKFFMHGGAGRDGQVAIQDVPQSMKEAMFIWHTKPGCCGYIAREALSCGKPLLIYGQSAHIHETLAVNYLKDGVNCIDIDPKVRTPEESAKLIKEWAQPENYQKRSEIIAEDFLNKINFEEEAKKIGEWLQQLK